MIVLTDINLPSDNDRLKILIDLKFMFLIRSSRLPIAILAASVLGIGSIIGCVYQIKKDAPEYIHNFCLGILTYCSF